MQSTLQQQAAAIKKAMKHREDILHDLDKKWIHENDEQWKHLNDAYSTIIALQLKLNLE